MRTEKKPKDSKLLMEVSRESGSGILVVVLNLFRFLCSICQPVENGLNLRVFVNRLT